MSWDVRVPLGFVAPFSGGDVFSLLSVLSYSAWAVIITVALFIFLSFLGESWTCNHLRAWLCFHLGGEIGLHGLYKMSNEAQ